MTRRGRGDGSLYYDRARRLWTGTVEVAPDPLTGRRRRRKVTAKTKTEALARLDDLKHERRRTGTVAPRDMTVGHVLAAWFAAPPASWRSPVTIAVNRQHAEKIDAALGKVKLAALTPGDVEAFLYALAAPKQGKGLSASTIKNVRGLLRAALRKAERDGLVARNAAALASLPRAPRKQRRALTMEQAAALLALDMTPWWRAYLITAIMLGLRPGELLGLRWEDADFANGVLRIRRSLKYDSTSGHQLADLKTERSHRTLGMPRAVAGTLRAHKASQAQARLARKGYQDMGLVFASRDGRPMYSATVNYGFKRLCERAGVEGEWTPYELRHTFVSIASAAGVSIEDIADAAGHVNAHVTRVVYRHVIADKVTRASEAMDRIFGEGHGG